jgi:tRNA modification GTPase
MEGTRISERKILVEAIKELLRVQDIDLSTVMIANERQLECTRRAIGNIQECITALREEVTYDAIIVCIESAIDPLLELTGSRITDTIVDEIFSKFCVGK